MDASGIQDVITEPRNDQKSRRWSWAPTVSQTVFCFMFQQLILRTLSFVALFRTAVERANCGLHKSLRTDGVPTSSTLLFWQWLTVSSVFTGGRAENSYSRVPDPPYPPSPINRVCYCGRKATRRRTER